MGKFIVVMCLILFATMALTNSTPTDDRVSEDSATNSTPIKYEVEMPEPIEVCECEPLGGLEVCECSDLEVGAGELEADQEIRELAQRELTMEEVVLLNDMTGAEYGM